MYPAVRRPLCWEGATLGLRVSACWAFPLPLQVGQVITLNVPRAMLRSLWIPSPLQVGHMVGSLVVFMAKQYHVLTPVVNTRTQD